MTKTILVVEDDPSLRHLIQKSLVEGGYTVLIAKNGLQGVEMVKKHGESLDLVLSDIQLPHLDGFEFLQEVRRLLPDVGIVLMSGQIDHIGIRGGLKESGERYLTKPFTKETLTEAIEETLRDRSAGAGDHQPPASRRSALPTPPGLGH